MSDPKHPWAEQAPPGSNGKPAAGRHVPRWGIVLFWILVVVVVLMLLSQLDLFGD
ncbi:hypothetical protein [Streptomyces sp. IMTB 2501]|uniref:hypothetical protein n=1 Tax=Streptomyces sp. IMTB 2501 TaxID=1776340 RepID=UPI0015BEBE73|nr:hypothetical protein [Streptomyces sp. IMTB 2501]